MRPAQLARREGISYVQAERIVRQCTWMQWRRYGWIGGVALAALLAVVGGAVLGRPLPDGLHNLLLAVASICTGLQLWLAQRAAYPLILEEARALRANNP